MHASEEVLALAGGRWKGGLNHYLHWGRRLVTTVQVDEAIWVVDQDDYSISRHALEEWVSGSDRSAGRTVTKCPDAATAWATLKEARDDCFVWQCGACDGWIYTAVRPVTGVLQCSTCGDGGVDFGHAYRHADAG